MQTPTAPIIRTATAADLQFVLALQKKFSNQVGFLPRMAIEEYIQARGVTLVEQNGDPAGYIIERPQLRSAKWCRPITQAAICLDAQRRHLGLALVDHVAAGARSQGKEALQCWPAADLQAVEFFTAAGFVITGERDPKNARGRKLLLMRKNLRADLHADFFTLPTVAGCVPRRLIPRSAA